MRQHESPSDSPVRRRADFPHTVGWPTGHRESPEFEPACRKHAKAFNDFSHTLTGKSVIRSNKCRWLRKTCFDKQACDFVKPVDIYNWVMTVKFHIIVVQAVLNDMETIPQQVIHQLLVTADRF